MCLGWPLTYRACKLQHIQFMVHMLWHNIKINVSVAHSQLPWDIVIQSYIYMQLGNYSGITAIKQQMVPSLTAIILGSETGP